MMPPIYFIMKTGLYRHFKGTFYLVLNTAQDVTSGADRKVVHYIDANNNCFVREYNEFHETVTGRYYINGTPMAFTAPRFKFICDCDLTAFQTVVKALQSWNTP